MDFFERTSDHVRNLNETERKIFEYVVRNMHTVKEMRIRTLAANCYISTTTILRFTQKLGFDGYRDFIGSLSGTCQTIEHTKFPDVVKQRNYGEEYLKNIIESVRVLSQEKVKQFSSCLSKNPSICFYGTGMDRELAHFAYRLFTSLGYRTYHPVEDYELRIFSNQLQDGDMLMLYSLSGQDAEVLELVERTRLRCNPVVATFTQSANNLLQNMSDIDFYVFTDKIVHDGLEISSRASMIALTELLAYSTME